MQVIVNSRNHQGVELIEYSGNSWGMILSRILREMARRAIEKDIQMPISSWPRLSLLSVGDSA
jgi:hypothetical protein